MEFVNLSGFIRRREQKKQQAKAELEEKKTQEIKEESKERNLIYIGAGAVALIGAGIIIYKTRKK